MPKQTWKCAVVGCPNLAIRPNIYCGWCAGYSHEMPKDEKKVCDKSGRVGRQSDVPYRKLKSSE